MNAARPPGYEAAVAAMHKLQRQAREEVGLDRPLFADDPLVKALKHAKIREDEAVPEGALLRCGLWRYDGATEAARWARTRRILQRSSPGPDEDGRYLEMIARQAASVEMVLCGDHVGTPQPAQEALCERLLLCTLPTQNLGAFADSHGSYHFVQISAGLIDFAYQATKATTLSWMPKTAAKNSLVSFSTRLEDVARVLDADPAPMHLLQHTVERYLFEGVARVRDSTLPPPLYHPPVAMLTSFNERFIVAHEIAHVLHQVHDVVYPGQAGVGEEFAADLLAFGWILEACGPLDRMAPNMATQGAFFVITALEILRQARDIARHGEVREDTGSEGHPPNAHRFAMLREAYLQIVSREDNDLSIEAALFSVRTLELLWKRLLESGRTQPWKGRALHRIWDGH